MPSQSSSRSRTRPLKILELKQDSSEVDIITENLDIITKALQACGASLVSIVAVMGTYRTGKSFLLDLLTRFLKTKAAQEEAELEKAALEEADGDKAPSPTAAILEDWEVADGWSFGEENKKHSTLPSWVFEGDAARIHEGSKLDNNSDGFAWRPGKDKCTQGIWLWSTPYVFRDKDGRKVAILLMDTQGAWDDTMTKAQSATIFGLTALLSSKLIYNIQNRIEEDKLENMDYITTFAQTVCSDLPGKEAPFGHLELLVRDWANYEDGFSLKQCKEHMDEHLDDHINPKKVPQDAVPRVERLKSTFKSIGAWGLPHPGLKVTKPTFSGEIDVIDYDFLYLLDKFSSHFFGGSFPQPSAPLGCEITPSSFKQIVMNFAKAFKDNAQDMAIGLREAFVKVEMVTARDDLHKRFRDQLNRFAPDSVVLEPEELVKSTSNLLARFREEFAAKLKPWRMQPAAETAAIDEFMQSLVLAVEQRVQQNSQQVEGATVKLVASPVVGGVGYFVFAHELIFLACLGIGAYFELNKWSKRENTEFYDPVVLQHVADDAKQFALQRWKDLQAIQVALNRLTPSEAVDSLMKASKQAGMLAAAAASSVSSSLPQDNSKKGN